MTRQHIFLGIDFGISGGEIFFLKEKSAIFRRYSRTGGEGLAGHGLKSQTLLNFNQFLQIFSFNILKSKRVL